MSCNDLESPAEIQKRGFGGRCRHCECGRHRSTWVYFNERLVPHRRIFGGIKKSWGDKCCGRTMDAYRKIHTRRCSMCGKEQDVVIKGTGAIRCSICGTTKESIVDNRD